MSKPVFIVASKRSPIGSFMGNLKTLTAPQLASIVVKNALATSGIKPESIDEVYFGNVLTASIGQAPANQVSIFSGISKNTPCTTVNKVCASGMKAIQLAAMSIELGINQVVLAGGMESMSNVPHYLPWRKNETPLGNVSLVDGIIHDGLWDPYHQFHMGSAAELCNTKYKITREQQDAFALQSYAKAQQAQKENYFTNEIVPITVVGKDKQEIIIDKDEEPDKLKKDKVPLLKPAFQKDGTITAANASKINDGSSCIILASEEAVKKYSLKPLAKLVSYTDASQDPEWFTTTPTLATKKLLSQTNLSIADIDFFEINEAFSCVAMVNQQELAIPESKLNVWGGAVALGHPIGCSGSRIVNTLISILHNNKAKYGCASICNGGGGASAVLIEKI